jgi:hypothetical protein
MQNAKRRFAPRLESLESIVALSGMSSGAAAAVAAKTLMLTGDVSGHYHAREIPDAGKFLTFTHGKGHLSPIGHVSLTGNISFPMLVSPPGATPNPNDATGTFVIANGKGSLTLHLTGPPAADANLHPLVFSYTITGATGKYRGDTGKGYIALQTTPAPTPTPVSAPGGMEHGHFQMEFLTVAPPTPA